MMFRLFESALDPTEKPAETQPPASLVASDDLEIFERCQRGLADSANPWIDMRRGVLADRSQADGSIVSGGTSELPIRHQFATWKAWMGA